MKIRKRCVSGKEYYYLEHSIRNGDTSEKKEKYLGREIPDNIDEIKREMLDEIYAEKWYPLFEKIQKKFSEEVKGMPASAKEKETQTFAIKFTYNTQKTEGSKLTLRETADLLEKNIAPKEKPMNDVKEAEGHKNVFYEMLNYKKDLSLEIVLYWHGKLFESTKKDVAGKIRNYGVAISGSKFIPPSPAEIYPLLDDFFKWYNKNKSKLHPVELASLVHLKFVSIHPFADGNGRISRLMMNFVLKKFNYPMLDIPYEKRAGYYNALERAQIKNEERIFVQWFFRRYVKEYERYLG